MQELREFKKKRKLLKAQIKATRAELASLEKELASMRAGYQHEAVDELEDWMEESSSRKTSFLKLLFRSALKPKTPAKI